MGAVSAFSREGKQMFRFYLANLQEGVLGIICFFAKTIGAIATLWFIIGYFLNSFNPLSLILIVACLVYVPWFSYHRSKMSYEYQVQMRQDAYERGFDGGYGQMPQGYQPGYPQQYGGTPGPYIPPNQSQYGQYGPPQGQNPYQY